MTISATATDVSNLVGSPVSNIFIPIIVVSNIGTKSVTIDLFAPIIGDLLGITIPAGGAYSFDVSQGISRKVDIYAKCLSGETTNLAITSF